MAKDTLKAQLERLVGRPAGPLLSALIELRLRNDCFDGLVAPTKWSKAMRKRFEDDAGLIIIGELAHGFFGPLKSRLGKTIDSSPMVYADKQGLPTEIAGRNLAELLGIWAFIPDFFNLYPNTAHEFDELHEELLGDSADNPELAKDVDAVLALPGVRRVKSGRELRKLLNELVVVANEVWPDEKVKPSRRSGRASR